MCLLTVACLIVRGLNSTLNEVNKNGIMTTTPSLLYFRGSIPPSLLQPSRPVPSLLNVEAASAGVL